MIDIDNPCISCGACCAWFRVSFYWAETRDGAGTVPPSLTEPLTPFLCCMKGTNSKTPRCEALQGEVGHATRCSIYHDRPSPCREFMQSGVNGLINAACDRARAHYDLPPLLILSSADKNLPSERVEPPAGGVLHADITGRMEG
ncbi:YkgJ family cysteine cluster protein [Affinibrenneria salicis]|uniref:YkgJ family cysteine cluster protein n=1 Tax=Affinibrenneria salicis TaxID=2590031 RepID=A0A5J5G480_9GAMM|nr:YkgJ family cysteine cluster protein [Affinibrenneria salicis]KAA9001830.1 YkgJ family cysteine cluster protein [Affinibrenneria salicis]